MNDCQGMDVSLSHRLISLWQKFWTFAWFEAAPYAKAQRGAVDGLDGGRFACGNLRRVDFAIALKSFALA